LITACCGNTLTLTAQGRSILPLLAGCVVVRGKARAACALLHTGHHHESDGLILVHQAGLSACCAAQQEQPAGKREICGERKQGRKQRLSNAYNASYSMWCLQQQNLSAA
jgi:hypothetical protein